MYRCTGAYILLFEQATVVAATSQTAVRLACLNNNPPNLSAQLYSWAFNISFSPLMKIPDLHCDIVPVGGRIKAAAVGMDLFRHEPPELDAKIATYRKHPPEELLKAFFPHDFREIAQFLNRLGIYRPTLKTDQGMAGNFFRFHIDPMLSRTVLKEHVVCSEEGIALPEPHYSHDAEAVRMVQKKFYNNDLHGTYNCLQAMSAHRAEKGRDPFFFIRPAMSADVPVFGRDIVQAVAAGTVDLLRRAVEAAAAAGDSRPANILYVQPDAYISADGRITIERVQCPDVGMFLESVDVPGACILPTIQSIMHQINRRLCTAILERIDGPITLLTRDAVLLHKEDMLEQGDIAVLQRRLGDQRCIDVRSVSQIDAVPHNGNVILMNIDYTTTATRRLLERHHRGEIHCFPNPSVQRMLQHMTDLPTKTIVPAHRASFLELARSLPKNEAAILAKIRRLHDILVAQALHADVLHATIGGECIPILAHASHSWRAFGTRCERYPNEEIRLHALPLSPDRSLLNSMTGKRMHVYRFAGIVSEKQ